MRYVLIVLCALLWGANPAPAQVSFSIGVPGVSIGVNVPTYPQLVQVPGYPVYYAPGLNSNYFFYDGMYWIFQGNNWYASSWYNGPWSLIGPEAVPVYLLRVPVRYYRVRPPYFRGWQVNAPPHWGEYWGPSWEQQRYGWNQWNRNAVPAPAPIPYYQRQYSGNRYPQPNQQQAIHDQNYRYRPQDPTGQQYYQQPRPHGGAPSNNPQAVMQGSPQQGRGNPPPNPNIPPSAQPIGKPPGGD